MPTNEALIRVFNFTIASGWPEAGLASDYEDSAEYHDNLMALATHTAGNRRLFLDCDGFLGMAPPTAQTGDVIVIFLGAQVPFLIRPHPTGGFRLAGECYVHGIMNGELMRGFGQKRWLCF